jgi:uncharacterized protein
LAFSPVANVDERERMRMRERPDGRPAMRQEWRQLAFLHWPIAPEAIARLLPPGLDVDTFDGVTYVGIVPFTIPVTRTGMLGLPMAPAFHEINVRTYVHRGGRDPGVWFFSLDATSRAAVAGARFWYGLPYFAADIGLDEVAGAVDYRSRRRGAEAAFHARYEPTGEVAPAAPGSLEFFLAERYLLYSHMRRGLCTARVHHTPYPLQPARASDVVQTLTAAGGLPPGSCVGPPPLVHYAREIDVAIYGPRG